MFDVVGDELLKSWPEIFATNEFCGAPLSGMSSMWRVVKLFCDFASKFFVWWNVTVVLIEEEVVMQLP